MACVYDYSSVLTELHARLTDSAPETFPTEEERSARPQAWAYLEHMRRKRGVAAENVREALLADVLSIQHAVVDNERNLRSVVADAWNEVFDVVECEPEIDEKIATLETELCKAVEELEQKQQDSAQKPYVAKAIGHAKCDVEHRLCKMRAYKRMLADTAKTRTTLKALFVEKKVEAAKKPRRKRVKAQFTSKRQLEQTRRYNERRAMLLAAQRP
jgi:hypothetical protein